MGYRDYDYCDESQIEDITHLYELRHCCNVFGANIVSQKLHVKMKRIEMLTNSWAHGSICVLDLLKCDENDVEKIMDELMEEVENEHEKKQEARMKNEDLVMLLREKRENFATIGTNKAKRRLNKIAKTDNVVKAIRLALEIEDVNILAKDARGDYRDRIYKKKEELINKLIDVFKENNWEYGTQNSDVPLAFKVIYFEIPTVEQLSWHCNNTSDLPEYKKEWDKKENATLGKLEIVVEKILKDNNLLEK